MLNNKEERCDYPGCMEKHTCVHPLDVTNDKNASVNLPFCEYHRFIVAGGRFTAKPEKIDFKIQGPLLEVEMAEQVFGSIELAKIQKKKSDQ